MNIITQIQTLQRHTKSSGPPEPWALLEDELAEGLTLFWSTAAKILQGSGVRLLDPSDGFFLLENNFFSALFLYSYHRRGIARSRRILYTAINQCLRGMVTGCDNILDDEYKKTLETDLPEEGVRFRSIVDIMVSDRVLFEILFDGLRDEKLTDRPAGSYGQCGFAAHAGAKWRPGSLGRRRHSAHTRTAANSAVGSSL
jgi:hypothetical protein